MFLVLLALTLLAAAGEWARPAIPPSGSCASVGTQHVLVSKSAEGLTSGSRLPGRASRAAAQQVSLFSGTHLTYSASSDM